MYSRYWGDWNDNFIYKGSYLRNGRVSVSREREIMGKRLLDKFWERYVVVINENGLDLLYIDLYFVYEVMLL